MQCEAVGGPAPEYVWLKDGDILSDSDKISIINHNTGSSLTLSNAANPDMGMYQCVAHNTHGYILTNSRLEVVCKFLEYCFCVFIAKIMAYMQNSTDEFMDGKNDAPISILTSAHNFLKEILKNKTPFQ